MGGAGNPGENLVLVLTLHGTVGDLVWLRVQPHNYGFVCVGVALSGLPGIPTPIFTFPLGAEEAPVPPPRYSGVLPRRVADSSDPCPAFLLTCLLPVLKPPGSGKERDYECSIQDTAWPSLSEKSFQGVGWRVLRCSASSQLHQKALRKAPSWVRHRALSHSPTLTPRYPYPIPWGNRLGMVSYCWGD